MSSAYFYLFTTPVPSPGATPVPSDGATGQARQAEAQSTQREGYCFDLSPVLSGQIKILSPAMRDRIRLFVRSRIIGVVSSTRAYCSKNWVHKKIKEVPPEGLGLFTPSVFRWGKKRTHPLCTLPAMLRNARRAGLCL